MITLHYRLEQCCDYVGPKLILSVESESKLDKHDFVKTEAQGVLIKSSLTCKRCGRKHEESISFGDFKSRSSFRAEPYPTVSNIFRYLTKRILSDSVTPSGTGSGFTFRKFEELDEIRYDNGVYTTLYYALRQDWISAGIFLKEVVRSQSNSTMLKWAYSSLECATEKMKTDFISFHFSEPLIIGWNRKVRES